LFVVDLTINPLLILVVWLRLYDYQRAKPSCKTDA
jgi:hypothetical protein